MQDFLSEHHNQLPRPKAVYIALYAPSEAAKSTIMGFFHIRLRWPGGAEIGLLFQDRNAAPNPVHRVN